VSKTNISEAEIISLLKKGDTGHYRLLVDKYKSYAYTLALRVVLVPEDAQEVTQDAFVKAYNSIGAFKGDAKFSTWLYRIVFNTAISRKRKKRLVQTDIDSAAGVASDATLGSGEQMTQKERKLWVDRAVNQLDEDDAFLVTLYYFQELTLDEIQEITGFTPNHSKVKIFRARKKMAEWLERQLRNEVTALI